MKTRIADLVVNSVAVAGIAAGLAFGSGFGAAAQQGDADNYFVQHPGPASGRTGIDAFDPYAPVDLTGSETAFGIADNAMVESGRTAGDGTSGEWSSSPRLPGRPY